MKKKGGTDVESKDDLLIGVARTIGSTLGAIVAKVSLASEPTPRVRRRSRKKAAGSLSRRRSPRGKRSKQHSRKTPQKLLS
jgi:hypothetical protein